MSVVVHSTTTNTTEFYENQYCVCVVPRRARRGPFHRYEHYGILRKRALRIALCLVVLVMVHSTTTNATEHYENQNSTWCSVVSVVDHSTTTNTTEFSENQYCVVPRRARRGSFHPHEHYGILRKPVLGIALCLGVLVVVHSPTTKTGIQRCASLCSSWFLTYGKSPPRIDRGNARRSPNTCADRGRGRAVV